MSHSYLTVDDIQFLLNNLILRIIQKETHYLIIIKYLKQLIDDFCYALYSLRENSSVSLYC
jgi:hypothetical protein